MTFVQVICKFGYGSKCANTNHVKSLQVQQLEKISLNINDLGFTPNVRISSWNLELYASDLCQGDSSVWLQSDKYFL